MVHWFHQTKNMVARHLHHRQCWLQLFVGVVPPFRRHGSSKKSQPVAAPEPAIFIASNAACNFLPPWFQLLAGMVPAKRPAGCSTEAYHLHRRQRCLQLFAGMVPAFRRHGSSKKAGRLQHRSVSSPSPAASGFAALMDCCPVTAHGCSSCAHGRRRSPFAHRPTTPPLSHPWMREELREHRSRTARRGRLPWHGWPWWQAVVVVGWD